MLVKKIDLINLFMHHSGEDISMQDIKTMMVELGEIEDDSSTETLSKEEMIANLKTLADCVVYTRKSVKFIHFSKLCQLLSVEDPSSVAPEPKSILNILNRIDYSDLNIRDVNQSTLGIISTILFLKIADKTPEQVVYAILIDGSSNDSFLDETIDHCLLTNKKSPIGLVNSSISSYLQNRNIRDLPTEYDDFKEFLINVRTCIDSMFAVNRDKLLKSLIDPKIESKANSEDKTSIEHVVDATKKSGDFEENLTAQILSQNLCRVSINDKLPSFRDAMIYLEFGEPEFGGLKILDSQDFHLIDDADLILTKSQIGKCHSALKVMKFLNDQKTVPRDIIYSMVISANRKIRRETKLKSLSNSLVYKEIYWSRCAIDAYLSYVKSSSCTPLYIDSHFIGRLLELKVYLEKAFSSDFTIEDLLTGKLILSKADYKIIEEEIGEIARVHDSINIKNNLDKSDRLLEELCKSTNTTEMEEPISSVYSSVINEADLSSPVKAIVTALSFLMTSGRTAKTVVVSALTGEANSHRDLDEALVSATESAISKVKATLLDPANQYLDKCRQSKTIKTSSKLVNYLRSIGDSLHEHNSNADDILKSDVNSYYDTKILSSDMFENTSKFNREDDIKSLKMDLVTFNSGISFAEVYSFVATGVSPDRRFYLFERSKELSFIEELKESNINDVELGTTISYYYLKSLYYLIGLGLDDYEIILSLISPNLPNSNISLELSTCSDSKKFYWLNLSIPSIPSAVMFLTSLESFESTILIQRVKSLLVTIEKMLSSDKTLADLISKNI